MFGTDHPAGSGTLEEIYRTMDTVGSGSRGASVWSEAPPSGSSGASGPTFLCGSEADRRRQVLRDERTKPDGQADGKLLERNVDDPAEGGDARREPDDCDRVGHGRRVRPGRHANHREARDRSLARERHRLPRVRVAARAQLPGGHGELTARAAANGGELAPPRLLEEG